MLIRRAFLMTVAGASLFWMLFGALDVPAAAAGVTPHFDGAAPSAASSGSNEPGQKPEDEPEDEPGHRCHGRGSGDPGDGDRCCEERRCRPEPSPRPTESPEPSAEATATPAPTSHPKRAASPVPRNPSPPAPPVAPRLGGITPRHASSVPARVQEPASGSRPPVLAPPELTIPAVVPGGASDSGGVGAVPVIALSTVLVAATVAAVSLVLMRRSS